MEFFRIHLISLCFRKLRDGTVMLYPNGVTEAELVFCMQQIRIRHSENLKHQERMQFIEAKDQLSCPHVKGWTFR